MLEIECAIHDYRNTRLYDDYIDILSSFNNVVYTHTFKINNQKVSQITIHIFKL